MDVEKFRQLLPLDYIVKTLTWKDIPRQFVFFNDESNSDATEEET